MELRHLRYFVAVADDLHFGRAANRLHTSQSSLSQQIRNLETELKVDLLRRVKRHVELTPAGARFLGEARGILAAADRAAGLARGTAREESRKIVIGISPETDWAFLGKALRLFGEHAPSVEVLFQNLTPEAQIEALHGSGIDIGFVGLPIEVEGIVSEVTGRERLVAAIPEAASDGSPGAHRAARPVRGDLRALAATSVAGSLRSAARDLSASRLRAADRDGRRASVDADRSRNGRRGPDRCARRPGDQAPGGSGNRLPSHRGSRRLHRIRRDLPAGRPVAAAGVLSPRGSPHASPEGGARGRRRGNAAKSQGQGPSRARARSAATKKAPGVASRR